MTVNTIQRRLIKLLAEKAKWLAEITEWGTQVGVDMSATRSSISSELCALKDACEAAEIEPSRIHEALRPTRSAGAAK